MDRPVLYTETENDRNVYFVANVPFEIVPEGFILALKNRDFVPMEYYANCKSYNECEYYWNLLGCTQRGKPVVFMYGIFDRLEKILCVNRLSIHPKWQSCKKDFMIELIKAVDRYSRQVGANRIIIITKNPNVYLRKLKNILQKSDNYILEVIEGVL